VTASLAAQITLLTPLSALSTVAEQTLDFIALSRATNTIRAYRSDWQHFTSWCHANGLAPLPAEPSTVALYLTAHTISHRTSTLERRLAAISEAYVTAGHS
jgi:site-specific recombinase XerD